MDVKGLKANLFLIGLQKATQDSQVSHCAVLEVCRFVVERQDRSTSRRPSFLPLSLSTSLPKLA